MIKHAIHTSLVRGIRRWDLVALVINTTIGASIFGLPSKLYNLIGAYSLFAFGICAFVIILLVLCFAEVSSRFSDSGGPYLYTLKAFGPIIGFEIGWLHWLAGLTAFATNCNLFITYLSYFWPPADSGLLRVGIIITVVASFTLINIVGIREAVIATNFFAIAKLIPLILFIGVGLFHVNSQNFSLSTQPSYSAFSTSVLLLIYTFSGFENAGITGGEIQEPRKNLPFACFFAIAIATLIYILIQFVSIGTFPGLANSDRPLADACSQFLGIAGASIISVGALISMAGSLNGHILRNPRLLYAMSEHHQLPGFLSFTHKKFRTPHFSILISATAMLVLTILNTFMSALIISTLVRLIIYAVTCIALIVLRCKKNVKQAIFKVRGGIVISIISLGLVAWLLSNSVWGEVRAVCLMAAVGLLIYFLFKLSQGKHSIKSDNDPFNKVPVEIN